MNNITQNLMALVCMYLLHIIIINYDQEEWHTYCQQGTLLKALLLLLHQVKGQNVAFFMEG